MTGPAAYRSSLARAAARSPSPETELVVDAPGGLASPGRSGLRPEDVRDDWTRQALINEANRLYGRRSGDGR